MPTILPSPPNRIDLLIAEIAELGGQMKADYHFTFAGGLEALEVSDALYAKWAAKFAPQNTGAAQAETRALAAGLSTVAEHHTHSHTEGLGRDSVAERSLHNYAATRDGNTITPRTAHDQNDGPVVEIATPLGLQISLTADNGRQPVSIDWGDGTAKGANPGDGETSSVYTYAAAGTYDVVVADAADPGASTTRQVTVTAEEPQPPTDGSGSDAGITDSSPESVSSSADSGGDSTGGQGGEQIAATATDDTDPVTGPKRRAPRAKK